MLYFKQSNAVTIRDSKLHYNLDDSGINGTGKTVAIYETTVLIHVNML